MLNNLKFLSCTLLIIFTVTRKVISENRENWGNAGQQTKTSAIVPLHSSSGFSFASSASGSNIRVSYFNPGKEILQNDDGVFTSPVKRDDKRNNATSPLDREQILMEMGVWDPPWSVLGKSHHNTGALQQDESNDNLDMDVKGNKETEELEKTLARVKIIPNDHHVSAFLNRGIVKRFLFINEKFGPLSITVTPCTSILLWVVKIWPIQFSSQNSTKILGSPRHMKTFRTQRSTTFSEALAPPAVFSVDIRPINWDSYVHLYATTGSQSQGTTQVSDSSSIQEQFLQHVFTHVETTEVKSTKLKDKKKSVLNIPDDDLNFNANLESEHQLPLKPRIWSQRLRGNRLHVKWDTSPMNPHLMEYCIVVNTRRDYASLCSASGERFGVLPPDLMHINYYSYQFDKSSSSQNMMMVAGNDYNTVLRRRRHRHHHGDENENQNRRESRRGRETSSSPVSDITIGCVGKKTNYILSNLHEGRLYYFNVFVRDTGSNVSYPYVRTTLKYQNAKKADHSLRDGKSTKVKLYKTTPYDNTPKPVNVTTLKFNLNKPCSELSLYVMPCGGGPLWFELTYVDSTNNRTGNASRTLYTSNPMDSLDIVKIAMPRRGKYFLKIFLNTNLSDITDNWPRMVEVYISKKNRRLPLPRLPPITKITEDETKRACDSVTLQWWPSPDQRDNEYCIFLKEEKNRVQRRVLHFKKPNQCDVHRSLRSDPFVTHSICVQRTPTPETMMLTQGIVGLTPGKTYVVQIVLKRHNGKGLSYDLHFVKTLKQCLEE